MGLEKILAAHKGDTHGISSLPFHQYRDPEAGAVFGGEECLHLDEQCMASKLRSETHCHERHQAEATLAAPPPPLSDRITQRELD